MGFVSIHEDLQVVFYDSRPQVGEMFRARGPRVEAADRSKLVEGGGDGEQGERVFGRGRLCGFDLWLVWEFRGINEKSLITCALCLADRHVARVISRVAVATAHRGKADFLADADVDSFTKGNDGFQLVVDFPSGKVLNHLPNRLAVANNHNLFWILLFDDA